MEHTALLLAGLDVSRPRACPGRCAISAAAGHRANEWEGEAAADAIARGCHVTSLPTTLQWPPLRVGCSLALKSGPSACESVMTAVHCRQHTLILSFGLVL